MYKALIKFRDIDGEAYNVDDTYPRHKKPTDQRIEQLLTSNNRTKAPVIIKIDTVNVVQNNVTNVENDSDTDSIMAERRAELSAMTVNQLREYAENNDICISKTTIRKDDIVSTILKHDCEC